MNRLLPLALLLTACSTVAGEPAETIGLGETLYRIIVGGIQIGEATLLRFYVWHIVGLIVPMIFLIGWHAFKVRRDGGISHQERAAGEPQTPRIDREQLVRTETLAFFITIAALIVISTFFDAPVGDPPNRGLAADEISAPWIFLWVQELLRLWPPAIAGVVVPLIVTGLLAALPFIDRTDEGVAEWFNRPGRIAQIIFILIVIVVGGLTLRGALR
ncbi:MAG: cytochrome b N-terminal domain-containing protein [Chloroflexota bacterium]